MNTTTCTEGLITALRNLPARDEWKLDNLKDALRRAFNRAIAADDLDEAVRQEERIDAIRNARIELAARLRAEYEAEFGPAPSMGAAE